MRFRRTACAAWLLLMIGPVSIGGCALIEAPFAAAKSRKNPALFPLPNRRTVVVVEAQGADALTEQFTRQVAASTSQQLADNAAVAASNVVPANEVVALKEQWGADAFRAMPIDEMGRRLNAETVVYVEASRVSLNADASFSRPEAQLQVRVVDTMTGQRLFPQPDAPSIGGRAPAYPVVAGRSFETLDPSETDRTSEARMRRDLAHSAGLSVARLFYDWQDDAPGTAAEAEKRRLEAARRRDREP